MRQSYCFGWTAAFFAFLLITCGCGDADVTESGIQNSPSTAESPISSGSETLSLAVSTTQQSEHLPAEATRQKPAAGLLGRASELLNDAQEATGQQASNTGQWLQGALNGASDSTGSAVDGSLDWANETFRTLKSQGLTTASSTGEWLSEDWQNMESWQYKVLAANSLPDAELEAKLNELGRQGWECFSIDDQRMIFKKASESYLKRLPFKDILRLAPLLNQGK